MIITSRHHWFWYPFFKAYSRYLPRLDFKTIHYHGEVEDRNMPILMIGNHFSWWDGFFALHLNQKYYERKFHIMMLEEQLAKRPMLNGTGAFSIKRGDRSMLETFAYAQQLLSSPENLVTLYPQGSIQSLYNTRMNFEKGWYRIVERLNNPIQIIFYNALVDYYSHRRPTLNLYLEEYDYQNGTQEELGNAFQLFYDNNLKLQERYL